MRRSYLWIIIFLSSCKNDFSLPEPPKEFIEQDFPMYYKCPMIPLTDAEMIAFEDSTGGKLLISDTKSNIKEKYDATTLSVHYPFIDEIDHASVYLHYDERNNIVVIHYYIFDRPVGSKCSFIKNFIYFEERQSYRYINPEIAYASKIAYIKEQWIKELRQLYIHEQIDSFKWQNGGNFPSYLLAKQTNHKFRNIPIDTLAIFNASYPSVRLYFTNIDPNSEVKRFAVPSSRNNDVLCLDIDNNSSFRDILLMF